jgi:predicted lipase
MITIPEITNAMNLSSLIYLSDQALETPTLQVLKPIRDKETDTFGAVVVDKTNKKLYIVFRGTQNERDMLTDIEFLQHTTKIDGKECKIHSGFFKAYESVKSQIDSIPFKEYDQYEIIICGHSLGGALATICGAYLPVEMVDHPIEVVTFGSPRVGNDKFGKIFMSKVSAYYRFVHNNDIVPTMPKINYKHTGKELRIDDTGKQISYFNLWKRLLYWIKGKQKLDLNIVSIEDHFMHNYIQALTLWFKKL